MIIYRREEKRRELWVELVMVMVMIAVTKSETTW